VKKHTHKTVELSIHYTRLAGAWRQKTALTQAVNQVLPLLLQQTNILPSGDYIITIALTNDAHQQQLNQQFRGKDKPTNVLSFPVFSRQNLRTLTSSAPMPIAAAVNLGDISLAYQTIACEAAAQGKPILHHTIHLALHGILHILGYDHQTAYAANKMEKLERDLLASLNIPDPYTIISLGHDANE
jgi:probable rRNA maturation factor